MISFSGDFHYNTVGEIEVFSNISNWDSRIRYHIILGDGGFCWGNPHWKEDPYSYENFFLKEGNKKNIYFLVLFGNHENYSAITSLPQIDPEAIGINSETNGKLYKINDRLFYLQRGHIYTIEGKRSLVLGGANSVDKERRTSYVSWWPEEIWSSKEINEFLRRWGELRNHHFDMILSHTAPSQIIDKILNGPNSFIRQDDPVSELEQHIIDDLDPSFNRWLFGHFHKDLVVQKKFICLYKTCWKYTDKRLMRMKPQKNWWV